MCAFSLANAVICILWRVDGHPHIQFHLHSNCRWRPRTCRKKWKKWKKWIAGLPRVPIPKKKHTWITTSPFRAFWCSDSRWSSLSIIIIIIIITILGFNIQNLRHFWIAEHLQKHLPFIHPETAKPPDMALSSLQAIQARGIEASQWYQIGSRPRCTWNSGCLDQGFRKPLGFSWGI